MDIGLKRYGLFNTVTDGGIKSIYDYVKEFCQKKQ